MKKFSFWLTLALASNLLLLNTGCWKKTTPVAEGNKNQVLYKGGSAEPEDLDPHIVTGMTEYKILVGLFEGLVSMDPKDLSPVPGVAETWDISSDGLIYTFHLNKDAKWSNGDPVTANDFIFSYNRALSKALGAPYASFLYPIANAEAFHKGEITDFSQVGIKALDDHTLQLSLSKPVPSLLNRLIHSVWYPVHKDSVLKHGPIDKRGSGWTRAGNLVSNGPFKLKSWEISKSVVLERNPNYWDNKTTRLNEIHFLPIENLDTEEHAFRTGQLHITERVPLPKVPYYRNKPNSELLLAPFFSTYAYLFNTTKLPFNDVRVREAVSMAIDRQALVDNVSKKGELVATSFTPPNVLGYKTTTKLDENIEAARRLLAEAGYPNGKGFPQVTMLYNTSEMHKTIAEALQQMLAKNLNIHIELVNQEWKVYLRARKEGDFNMIRFGWAGDYLDPNAFLEVFTSEASNNFARWKNPEFDKLITEASETLNQKQRFAYFDKAENILIDELPVVPLYYWTSAYLVSPSVKGWYPNILDIHPYKYVYLQ